MDALELLIAIANERHGGHVTIMKVTTNWRCAFGTVHSNYYEAIMAGRPEEDRIRKMPCGKTMEDAIYRCIIQDFHSTLD